MARVNVYLPDELARRARAANLNMSSLAQEALRKALDRSDTEHWLDELDRLPVADVSHQSVMEALTAAREEFGG